MLQILLKSGSLGLVCMVSRVESRFTMSLPNSRLHIARCSLLLDVLKVWNKRIMAHPGSKAVKFKNKFLQKKETNAVAQVASN